MRRNYDIKIDGKIIRYIGVGILLFMTLFPAAAGSNRNITSFIYNYYFPLPEATTDTEGTYRIDSSDVFLLNILPILSLKAEIARTDSYEYYKHDFILGPIINFTNTFYMEAVYGLGLDSDMNFSHKIDLNFNQETDTSSISFGIRAHYYVTDTYYYYIPSVSAAIYPVSQLRLFSKLFFSSDRYEEVSGSLWSEIGWKFTSLFAAHAGFTISYTDEFGFSVIGGCTWTFTKKISLKYFFEYLSNRIEYTDKPTIRNGIGNGLILDIRF